MKITQFANFANNATKQILGTSGLIRENLQSMFSYPNAISVDPVTVSGGVIHIEDAAPVNAKSVKVYIEPLQTGSGDPSPNNIRPINGWSEAIINANGVNISISFPNEAGKIYGGTLDVTKGILIVDRAYALLNDASKWGESGGTVKYRYNVLFNERKQYPNSVTGVICSFVPIGLSPLNGRWAGASSNYFGITAGDLTLSEIQSAAIAGDISICYTLDIPISYQLTPIDILMLNGDNTIYADCGSMELQYYRYEGGGNPYD